jgi:hypothetical protein
MCSHPHMSSILLVEPAFAKRSIQFGSNRELCAAPSLKFLVEIPPKLVTFQYSPGPRNGYDR